MVGSWWLRESVVVVIVVVVIVVVVAPAVLSVLSIRSADHAGGGCEST